MKITCTGTKSQPEGRVYAARGNKTCVKLDKFFFRQRGGERYRDRGKDWQTVEVTVKDKGLYEPCREIGRPYGRCVRRGGEPADAAHR